MIEVCTVGGFGEVGKNMTAIKYQDEVVILDMGINLPKLIDFEEEGGNRKDLTKESLIKMGAIPNDNVINHWKHNVKAILTTHCHLDHIAAMPYLANQYNCPIIATPFTIEVIRSMFSDENINLSNKLIALNPGSSKQISKNFYVDFINVTHSTLQTVIIALHTPDGIILYANDFKLDNSPVLGNPPDYAALNKLGKKHNVKMLIVDSLYASKPYKTPSEKVAREMLKDVLLGTSNEDHAIIATTFASHLARLKSIAWSPPLRCCLC